MHGRALLLACAALAAGCGSDGPRSDSVKLGTGRPGATVVAALGDSITAGSPLWDPDPAVRDRIGQAADPESQYGYWAQLRLKNTSFRNCGVSGERTDEIARRLGRCATGARVLIVQGGINDIAQGRQVEATARDLRKMAEEGRRRRLRVALVEVLPWNNGFPGADPKIRALNRLIRAIGQDLRVPVLSWYRVLEDPKAPGRMRRDLTIDGDHPSVAGYRRLARTIRLGLRPPAPSRARRRSSAR